MAAVAFKSIAPMVERLIRERRTVSVRLRDGLEFHGVFKSMHGPEPLVVYPQEEAGTVGFFVDVIKMIEDRERSP